MDVYPWHIFWFFFFWVWFISFLKHYKCNFSCLIDILQYYKKYNLFSPTSRGILCASHFSLQFKSANFHFNATLLELFYMTVKLYLCCDHKFLKGVENSIVFSFNNIVIILCLCLCRNLQMYFFFFNNNNYMYVHYNLLFLI